MEAVAALCEKGSLCADVGCDHGYVSIRLLQDGVFERMLAMDLRKGPLSSAKQHIAEEGLSDRIECRLSDGLRELRAGEADALICAGMGGELIQRILSDGRDKLEGMKQLILQPQSDVRGVREYLYGNGYIITAEDMVFEDGKYYRMFRAVPGSEPAAENAGERELYLEYGRQTLQGRHPVLKRYLEQRIVTETAVREQMHTAAEQGSLKAAEKLKDRDAELELLKGALSYYN